MKHRRILPLDGKRSTDGTPYADIFDVQNDAACTCAARGWHTCPRHNAATYADQCARHAVDSIMPGSVPYYESDRAERYHTDGITR